MKAELQKVVESLVLFNSSPPPVVLNRRGRIIIIIIACDTLTRRHHQSYNWCSVALQYMPFKFLSNAELKLIKKITSLQKNGFYLKKKIHNLFMTM